MEAIRRCVVCADEFIVPYRKSGIYKQPSTRTTCSDICANYAKSAHRADRRDSDDIHD